MRKPSAFAQSEYGQTEEYKNAPRYVKTSMRMKIYWADYNSGVRNRESEKGKTYEEIHGVKRAKELKALRKESRYWEHVTDEQRKINSQKAWDTPEHAIKTSLAQGRKPNKLEIKFMEMLNNNFPNEWKFVGDGQVWINRANPDFFNTNGRKLLIEVYTPYYKEKCYGSIDNYIKVRGVHFAQYGFRTLFFNLYNKDWNLFIEQVRQAQEGGLPSHPSG